MTKFEDRIKAAELELKPILVKYQVGLVALLDFAPNSIKPTLKFVDESPEAIALANKAKK